MYGGDEFFCKNFGTEISCSWHENCSFYVVVAIKRINRRVFFLRMVRKIISHLLISNIIFNDLNSFLEMLLEKMI